MLKDQADDPPTIKKEMSEDTFREKLKGFDPEKDFSKSFKTDDEFPGLTRDQVWSFFYPDEEI